MDLTPTFNDAAAGPPSEPTAVEGGGPHDFGGGGSAAEEYASETPETVETASETQVTAPSEAFEEAVVDAEEAPEPPLTIADAEAELAELEAGRPSPTLRDNFDPPRKLQQIVHTGIERERENRVFALKAYIEHAGPDPDPTPEHDLNDHPEPAL